MNQNLSLSYFSVKWPKISASSRITRLHHVLRRDLDSSEFKTRVGGKEALN